MNTAFTHTLTVVVSSVCAFAPPKYMVKWYPATDTRWTLRFAGACGLAYEFIGLYVVRHAGDLTAHSKAVLDVVRHTCGGMAVGLLIATLLSHYFRKQKI
jgi:hypothetical protein